MTSLPKVPKAPEFTSASWYGCVIALGWQRHAGKSLQALCMVHSPERTFAFAFGREQGGAEGPVAGSPAGPPPLLSWSRCCSSLLGSGMHTPTVFTNFYKTTDLCLIFRSIYLFFLLHFFKVIRILYILHAPPKTQLEFFHRNYKS